jgi:hypothetical protein
LILKLQTDFPVESVAAVFVVVPVDVTRVKVTVAPAAASVPCVTVAEIVAVEFLTNGTVGTDTETEIGCTGTVDVGGGVASGFTVRFALPSVEADPVPTRASTEYVAATVPAGTDFSIVVETVEPGATVRTLSPNDVGQVPGRRDDMLNDCGEQPDVSLFVTDTV